MDVATTPEVNALLHANAPVAIGVSGGKDSSAVAFATVSHLDRIGHKGPRLLVHSDLGATEWAHSLPWCQRLAARLGMELLVVQRSKGDMMDRWEQRWADNVARYENLECVKLILPWSTPEMRFCTSEMKVDIICRELSKRFSGQRIVNVNGIRRDESAGRARRPVSKTQPKLTSKTRKTSGIDWHPCIEWSLRDVLDYLKTLDFPLHPAYETWGLSRVSCVFCIMSNANDLINASRCPENTAIYRRMVALEARSTFAFQGDKWLGDVAPALLSSAERGALQAAKENAAERCRIEERIYPELLYVKGWPVAIPTKASAALLGEVRSRIGALLNLNVKYLGAISVIQRYEQLWHLKHDKDFSHDDPDQDPA